MRATDFLSEETYLDALRDEQDRGPAIWDADPDVCCPAFQLGACEHTETFDPSDLDDDPGPTVEATTPPAPYEEPF